MEYKNIMDQIVIIISNSKSQIILPKIVFLVVMNTNYVIVPVLTNNTVVSSMEILLVGMGNIFQSGGVRIVLIKSQVNIIHTHN